MDKGTVKKYNRDSCVGSSVAERSHSCERGRCNSVPSAPFLLLEEWGLF